MPYVLMRQDLNPNVWVVEGSDAVDFTTLRTGAQMEMPKNVTFGLREDSQLPSDLLESPYFIVSERMRRALVDFGVDNIQFVQVALRHEGSGATYSSYHLGNIVGLIQCVDAAKSAYKQLTGNKRILRGFVVDEEKAQGLMLFRLRESPGLVLVAERLRRHLLSLNLVGLYFQETTSFTGHPVSSLFGR